MFALVSESNRGRQVCKSRRAWPSRPGMEVVSINEFERHQLEDRDRIMDSAVDQLEAFTQPNGETADMVVQFGEMKVDDSLPRLFEFDPPTTCRRWPGLRFGSFCLHKQIPKSNFRMKPNKRSSEKKHGRMDDFKHGVHPRKTNKHKPEKAHTQVSNPTATLPISSRDPPLRLMDLPSEVRNEIWTLLSVHQDPIEAQLRPIQPRRKGKIVIRRFPQEPPLAAVNSQLRKEVLSLFYGLNKFVLESSVSSALKHLDMTKTSTILKWKPRADVANYISQVEIRFAVSSPAMKMVVYEIKRMVDDSLFVNTSHRTSKKTGTSSSRAMCLCAEKIIARFSEDTCGGKDILEVAMALSRKWLPMGYAPVYRGGDTCTDCGLEKSKY